MENLEHTLLECRTYVNTVFDMEYINCVSMNRVEFNRCTFDGVKFTQVFMDNVRFYRCEFVNCVLDTVVGTDVQVERSTITGGRWKSVRLRGGGIHATTLNHTNWLYVRLEDMIVAFLNVGDSVLDGMRLLRTTMSRCTSTNVRWLNSNMQDSTIAANAFIRCTLMQVLNNGGCRYNRNMFEGSTLSLCFLNDQASPERRCVVCRTRTGMHDLVKGMCESCRSVKNYSHKNDTRVGKESRLPSFSFEFEVDMVDYGEDTNPLDLLRHRFERCSDGSVQDEYKSPIYLDMRGFKKVLPLLDKLQGCVHKPTCGTHIHVGFTNKGRLAIAFEQVIGPLVGHMRDNPEETEEFWGRDFCNYAVGEMAMRNERYFWLNVNTYQPTIEFRLPQFRDAKQFEAVVRFVRSLAKYLDSELNRPRSTEAFDRIGQNVLQMYTQAVNRLLVTA